MVLIRPLRTPPFLSLIPYT